MQQVPLLLWAGILSLAEWRGAGTRGFLTFCDSLRFGVRRRKGAQWPAEARTKIARTSAATPLYMICSGCFPAPFHSPVATPHALAVITISDMNSGQPNTAPREPSSP